MTIGELQFVAKRLVVIMHLTELNSRPQYYRTAESDHRLQTANCHWIYGVRLCLFLISMVCGIESAMAACTWSAFTPGTSAINIAGNIDISEDVPVNSVIHTIDYPTLVPNTALALTCAGPVSYPVSVRGSRLPDAPNIYDSGYRGIGIRFTYGGRQAPFSSNIDVPLGRTNFHYADTYSAGRIEFIKTGVIASGALNGSGAGRLETTVNGRLLNAKVLVGSLSITTTRTCDFGNGVANFRLGEVGLTDFEVAGSTSPWVQGALPSGGCQGVQNVYMSFGGTPVASNASLFQPTVANAARGVGIEIQGYDGIAAQPAGAGEMRWSPRASGSPYEFRARMVRTAGELRPGETGTSITVTMRYD